MRAALSSAPVLVRDGANAPRTQCCPGLPPAFARHAEISVRVTSPTFMSLDRALEGSLSGWSLFSSARSSAFASRYRQVQVAAVKPYPRRCFDCTGPVAVGAITVALALRLPAHGRAAQRHTRMAHGYRDTCVFMRVT